MSICPHCGKHTPTTNEKLRGMFAARVGMPAKINRRSPDASHNEMATAIRAADEAVMRSMCVPAYMLTSGTSHATATEHTIRAAIDGDARAIRTVVRHAEDVIDPRSACVEPRRAVDTEDAPVVKLGQGDYSAEWFARGLGLRSGGVQ